MLGLIATAVRQPLLPAAEGFACMGGRIFVLVLFQAQGYPCHVAMSRRTKEDLARLQIFRSLREC